MDFWEVPCSSCSGLDRGFLMDLGPKRTRLVEVSATTPVAARPCRNSASRLPCIDQPSAIRLRQQGHSPSYSLMSAEGVVGCGDEAVFVLCCRTQPRRFPTKCMCFSL